MKNWKKIEEQVLALLMAELEEPNGKRNTG